MLAPAKDGCAEWSAWRSLLESVMCLAFRDLQEFMTCEEFKRRSGGVGQPARLKMRAEIERRIAALPLYR